jgi:hypothetical protein
MAAAGAQAAEKRQVAGFRPHLPFLLTGCSRGQAYSSFSFIRYSMARWA